MEFFWCKSTREDFSSGHKLNPWTKNNSIQNYLFLTNLTNFLKFWGNFIKYISKHANFHLDFDPKNFRNSTEEHWKHQNYGNKTARWLECKYHNWLLLIIQTSYSRKKSIKKICPGIILQNNTKYYCYNFNYYLLY